MTLAEAPPSLGARALPWAIGGLATIAYVATAARVVVAPDNGEFATLFAVGGVAHPSGYPLYVLWLRAWRWLPAVSPAHGAALATVILGVLSLALIYRACRAWGASRDASCIVLAAHAFSSPAWIMATHAEAFALNATIAAAILLVARVDDPRVAGVRRVALLGLLAGLGIANHHTIVLLAPIGLWGAARGVREARAKVAAAAAGVGALALGLTPYLHTFYVARHPQGHWVWGDPSTFSALLFHFRRGAYGSTVGLSGREADRFGQIVALAVQMTKSLWGLPVLALVQAFRTKGAPERVGRWLLLASFVLAGPAFLPLLGITAKGLDRVVVARFWLLPQVVLVVLIAPLLDPLLAKLFEKRHATSALAGLLVAFGVLFSYLDVKEHHAPAIELYLRNTLSIAPPRAIILGTGDHRLEGFLYMRRALGVRPDVDYIDIGMVNIEWYRRQASEAVGVELAGPIEGSLNTRTIAAQLLGTGRPVFLADIFSDGIETTFPTYPYGTLIRVLPVGSTLPDPMSLEAENVKLLDGFTFDETKPTEDSWAGNLQPSYARPWEILAPIFGRGGFHDHEAACRERAARLMPASAE